MAVVPTAGQTVVALVLADLGGCCLMAVAALCRCRSMAVVPTAGQTVVALVLADLADCCLMAVAALVW